MTRCLRRWRIRASSSPKRVRAVDFVSAAGAAGSAAAGAIGCSAAAETSVSDAAVGSAIPSDGEAAAAGCGSGCAAALGDSAAAAVTPHAVSGRATVSAGIGACAEAVRAKAASPAAAGPKATDS